MNTEIERKFLIKPEFNSMRDLEFKLSLGSELEGTERMRQGYIMGDKGKSLRIREVTYDFLKTSYILGLKIKVDGMTRQEFEYDIPEEDGILLLEQCKPNLVEKVRWTVFCEGKFWEIDFFSGRNEGLIMAEIELKSKDEQFKIPDFIGEEVTDKIGYSNHFLSHSPWPTWKNK